LKKILVALSLALSAASSALAAYPEKPVTLVAPVPPGGSTDAIARVLAQKLQEKMGQSFVVHNQAGASGTIGAASVARAPADGYTLLISAQTALVSAPHLIESVPYDPLKDFEPITIVVQSPNILLVPAASPIKNLADLLADLKKEPAKYSFATSGVGATDHLATELLWQQSGTQGLHVPYKGSGHAINALLGNEVDAGFANINTTFQLIVAGKLRALGIASEKRSPLLPDVPTLDELGIKGAEVKTWQIVVAPKGLPEDVRTSLHAAIVDVLDTPAVKDNLLAQGVEIVANTPEQAARAMATEYALWKELIETQKLTID